MSNEHKKVSFRIDVETFDRLKEVAQKNYLTVSAFIRKTIDKCIEREVHDNELS